MPETIDMKKDIFGHYTNKGALGRFMQEAYITGLVISKVGGRFISKIPSVTSTTTKILWQNCFTKENMWRSTAIGLIGGLTSTVGLLHLKESYENNHLDPDGYRIGSLAGNFNHACSDKDANMRLFCQYSLNAAEEGASPVATMYKAFAETGGFDLQGMRHGDSGLPYYNGPGQTGYAKLIDYIRLNVEKTSFYRHGDPNDHRIIAINAMLDDPRLRQNPSAIEDDMLDGRVDYVETIIRDLANDPVFMGQVFGVEVKKHFPELMIENLPDDPQAHIAAVQENVGLLMLHNVAGPTGYQYLKYFAEHYPDIQISDTEKLTEIIVEASKEEGLVILSTEYFSKTANANKNTIFLEGMDTKFGNIPEYSNRYVIQRANPVFERLMIDFSGLSGKDIYQANGQLYTTAPTSSLRPQARPTGITTLAQN